MNAISRPLLVPTLVYSYLRFSTKDQLKGFSQRRQRKAFDRWIAAQIEAGRPLVAAEVNYEDLGASGYSGDHLKGAFGALLKAVEDDIIPRGSFILVEDWDRFGRLTPWKSARYFRDLIDEGGCIVVTLSDEIEYSQYYMENHPNALTTVSAVMERAHMESVRKQDMALESYEDRRALNEPITSRGPAWLRYVADEQGKRFEPIPDRVAVVRDIYEWSASGLGLEGIALRLNQRHTPTFVTLRKGDGQVPIGSAKQWSSAYVSKILRWRAVLGEYQPCKTSRNERGVKIAIPVGAPRPGYYGDPVIGLDLWIRVQAALDTRVKLITSRDGTIVRRQGVGGSTGIGLSNIFQRFAVCAGCGAPMTLQSSNSGTYRYLRCSVRKVSRSCDRAGYAVYDEIERKVLDIFSHELMAKLAPATSDIEEQTLRQEAAERLSACQAITAKRQRIIAEIGEDDLDARVIVRKLAEDRTAHEVRIREIESLLSSLRSRGSLQDRLADYYAVREASNSSDLTMRHDARLRLSAAVRTFASDMRVDVTAETVRLRVADRDVVLQFRKRKFLSMHVTSPEQSSPHSQDNPRHYDGNIVATS